MKVEYGKLCLIVLLFSTYHYTRGQTMSEGLGPRAVNFQHESPADFEQADIRHMEYIPARGGFELTHKNSTTFLNEGTLTSPILTAEFPFNNLVLSWNADVPKGTFVIVEAQVKEDSSKWSSWYEMANFSLFDKSSSNEHRRGSAGRVFEDELRLRTSLKQFRYRVSLHTNNSAVTPTLHLVGVSYADMRNRIPVHDKLTLPADSTAPLPSWVRDLDVPWRSQTVLPRNIAGSACHPTSLAMVLQYYGTDLPTTEVAENVFDPVNEIFGNWPYNAAYAASLGYKSYVIRCNSFDPVKEEIAKGRPVIISIAFRRDTLTGSPIHGSGGHIIVVRGFTKDGNPICNDPAARTEEKGHVVYKKDELERAWLGHGGATVIVEPRENKS